jgi:hypothetical protein
MPSIPDKISNFRDDEGPKSSKNNHQDAAYCSNHEVKDKRVAQAGKCCEGNHCTDKMSKLESTTMGKM